MGIRLGIIGGGNMGRAVLEGALRAGVLEPDAVVVAEIDPLRREALAATGATVTPEPGAAAAAEQIMLAVKPQAFPGVAGVVAPLAEERVVISIMAGLHSRTIRAALGERARVVRVMPNTPCRVGEGMTAVALGDGARPGDERLALALFEALGRTAIVDETLMHAVTAVSGSGPAYVFLLAEALEQAAADLGLDATTARLLSRQTVTGAGRLLAEAAETAAELRAAVTSPGGTTEAALRVLRDRGWPQILADAVTAARDRGVELDQEKR